VAVVSDAGTPSISDSGYSLVKTCIEHNIEIVPIPGATALLSALVISGLPTDRFCFEGFLPKSAGRLRSRLTELANETRTMIFFESPYRLRKSLPVMFEIFGDRQAFIGRELTKKFEQTYRGSLGQLLERFSNETPKGELVLAVAGAGRDLKAEKFE